MGCGASQGDSPELAPEPAKAEPVETAPAAEVVEAEALGEPIERRLFPHSYSSSSHLENDWNKFQENYLASYLGDDNPKTSWTEGKSDVGLGESITVEHTSLDDATRLRLEIRNGYQKSPRLFTRNARARDITVKLLPSGTTTTHLLTDSEGWQSLMVEQPRGPLRGYEIRFDSAYKGTHYEDLVVSDIQTYVTAQTPDNPSFEMSKKKKLLSWIKARKLAAQTFKEAAKGSIPVAPVYQMKKDSNSLPAGEDCMDDCPLPFARAAQKWSRAKAHKALAGEASSEFAGWKQVRISAVDQRQIPQADVFRYPGSWSRFELFEIGDEPSINLPMTQQMAYFSSKALKRVYVEEGAVSASSVLKSKAPGCKREDKEKQFFFTPTETGAMHLLLIAACGLHESRDGYSEGSYWQLLAYGDGGSLEYIFDFYSAHQFSWQQRSGAPFLKKVARVSTAGAYDTVFVAK